MSDNADFATLQKNDPVFESDALCPCILNAPAEISEVDCMQAALYYKASKLVLFEVTFPH